MSTTTMRGVTDRTGRHLVAVPDLPSGDARSGEDRLRLTPRGRALVYAVAVTVVAVVFLVLAGAMPARGSEGPQATVTVQEGETLDSLAARYLPNTPRFEAVQLINRANRLNSQQVQAGRVLVIPADAGR